MNFYMVLTIEYFLVFSLFSLCLQFVLLFRNYNFYNWFNLRVLDRCYVTLTTIVDAISYNSTRSNRRLPSWELPGGFGLNSSRRSFRRRIRNRWCWDATAKLLAGRWPNRSVSRGSGEYGRTTFTSWHRSPQILIELMKLERIVPVV